MNYDMSSISLETPIGALTLAGDERGLTHIHFPGRGPAPHGDPAPLREAAAQLREYFAGERRTFDLRLRPAGSAFQRAVWDALAGIPYGETTSYAALARRLDPDDPLAARAVGSANARNPLPIVVPCHRVVGADGSLTGFAGGLETKRALLDFEASGVLDALRPGWERGQLSLAPAGP